MGMMDSLKPKDKDKDKNKSSSKLDLPKVDAKASKSGEIPIIWNAPTAEVMQATLKKMEVINGRPSKVTNPSYKPYTSQYVKEPFLIPRCAVHPTLLPHNNVFLRSETQNVGGVPNKVLIPVYFAANQRDMAADFPKIEIEAEFPPSTKKFKIQAVTAHPDQPIAKFVRVLPGGSPNSKVILALYVVGLVLAVALLMYALFGMT